MIKTSERPYFHRLLLIENKCKNCIDTGISRDCHNRRATYMYKLTDNWLFNCERYIPSVVEYTDGIQPEDFIGGF